MPRPPWDLTAESPFPQGSAAPGCRAGERRVSWTGALSCPQTAPLRSAQPGKLHTRASWFPTGGEEGKPSQDSLQYEKPPIPHTVPALNGVPSVGQALYYVSSCMNSSTPQKTLCSKADSQSHFTVEKTKAQKAKRCDL